MRHDDTDPALRARYFEHLRRLAPEQKAAILDRLVRDAKALALAGLRQRHPEASEAELEIRRVAMIHGRAVAAKLGPVPADAAEFVARGPSDDQRYRQSPRRAPRSLG